MEGNPNEKVYDEIYSKPEKFFGRTDDYVQKLPTYLEGGEILDIGAGQGRNAFWLAQNGYTVDARDISEVGVNSMNAVAKERGVPLVATKGDAREAIEKNYDAIVFEFVSHYLRREDGLVVLEDIKTHTKIGGVNVVAGLAKDGDFFRRTSNPGNFYFEIGELKEIYKDWDILEYEEEMRQSVAKKEDGSPMFNLTAKIIARKK